MGVRLNENKCNLQFWLKDGGKEAHLFQRLVWKGCIWARAGQKTMCGLKMLSVWSKEELIQSKAGAERREDWFKGWTEVSYVWSGTIWR